MNNFETSLLLISVFKNVLEDETVSAFKNFIINLNSDTPFETIIKSYSDFIGLLYNKCNNVDLYSYVNRLIYTDENILSKYPSEIENDENNFVISSASHELSLFNTLLLFDYTTVTNILQKKFPEKYAFISELPEFKCKNPLPFDIYDIIESYKKKGYGIFANYSAFKFTSENKILPVKHFDSMTFKQLKNYEYQKDVIKKNTLAFLKGKEANNILLYGDRGCGKSSTVKALINEFSQFNVKIIQVYKESIIYLEDLFDKIRNLPCKFIIFADDLSFDESDKNFSSVKAILEGSLSNRPKNTVIYATTNRIHMVRESFSSREGNEIHINDTIDETVSLSDRFGIVLTFSLLNKNEYDDIVKKIAADYGIKSGVELLKKAEEFSMLKGIRTPRVAKQFIVNFIAEK